MVGGAGKDTLSDPATLSALHLDTPLVAALAFAGADFYTLRLFLRAVVCQLVRVMLDDLHVYRLEQLWNHIHFRLTPKKAAEPKDPAVEPDTPAVAAALGPDPSELAPGDPSAITVARSPDPRPSQSPLE